MRSRRDLAIGRKDAATLPSRKLDTLAESHVMQDGSFARIFKRLKNIGSRSHGSHPTAPPPDRARTAAAAVSLLPTAHAIAHGVYIPQTYPCP
mgnify:CR=1 FL=1